jgi:DNA-binding transcriptional LysR family regulator
MPFRRGHLRYFVTVVEEGQMTRAAKRLEVAQPALSQAISQLESEVGVKLLDRHARGVSLTPAGEEFYEKAKLAVAAAADAAQTAESLSRGEQGAIDFGFVGVPPGVDSLELLEAFAAAHPGIDIRYRELPFPSPSTSAWLSEVDVAVCHQPPIDAAVWSQRLRVEQRLVLAPSRHLLAERGELSVEEVLDQTFVAFADSVDRGWASFWNLDDHRGGPPAHVTDDRARNPHEMMAALAVRDAITTVPASVKLILNLLTGVVAIPLRDAHPSTIMLVGHNDRRNPQVDALVAFAATVTA